MRLGWKVFLPFSLFMGDRRRSRAGALRRVRLALPKTSCSRRAGWAI